MQIIINTEEPFNDVEKAVLRALLGEEVRTAVVNVTTNVDEDDKPEPAKKAAPAKKAPAKKAAAKKPEPDPEPDEEEEQDDEQDDEQDPLDVAVARATDLLSQKKGAKVKAALEAAGAKKVSDLKGDAVQVFLEALDA